MSLRRTFPLACAILLPLLAPATDASEIVGGTERTRARAYSPAVVTEGGRTIWLAGQGVTQTEDGTSLVGNFDEQVRATFRGLDRTLRQAGGSVRDMVSMTVFIKDVRHGDRFVEIRREFFTDGRFPGSALITITALARPEMLIEIQGVAVIGDRCGREVRCLP
jgi:enamine deaminase RidA (YjgF/YER057c/UK114 family)